MRSAAARQHLSGGTRGGAARIRLPRGRRRNPDQTAGGLAVPPLPRLRPRLRRAGDGLSGGRRLSAAAQALAAAMSRRCATPSRRSSRAGCRHRAAATPRRLRALRRDSRRGQPRRFGFETRDVGHGEAWLTAGSGAGRPRLGAEDACRALRPPPGIAGVVGMLRRLDRVEERLVDRGLARGGDRRDQRGAPVRVPNPAAPPARPRPRGAHRRPAGAGIAARNAGLSRSGWPTMVSPKSSSTSASAVPRQLPGWKSPCTRSAGRPQASMRREAVRELRDEAVEQRPVAGAEPCAGALDHARRWRR